MAGGEDSALGGPALHLARVERRYAQGEGVLAILRGAELVLHPGEMVALVAPSGAGKSTLLHIAGLLEKPDGGDVILAGRSTRAMADAERTRARREEIGFVYQFHHLLPEFTALENVAMPQMIRGLARKEAPLRAAELLTFLGLGQRLPVELAVRRQRQLAEHDESRRNHVLRQPPAQVRAQLASDDSVAAGRHDVGDQPLITARLLARQHDGLPH